MKTLRMAIVFLFLAGCTPDGNAVADIPQIYDQACSDLAVGFWMGLWHGLIAPFSWFFSLFMSDVNVYEVCNNGGWYDFGFVLGAGILGGASGRSSRD